MRKVRNRMMYLKMYIAWTRGGGGGGVGGFFAVNYTMFISAVFLNISNMVREKVYL